MAGLAQAGGAVDLALVLSIDCSASVDYDEFALMIGGTAAAFRDSDIVARALSGPAAAVAVAVLFWSGPGSREVAVPWRRIASEADAVALADAIDNAPRTVAPGATALGEGIIAASALLAACPFPPGRRVIDVAGDGRGNVGLSVADGRAAALALGHIINGLAVVNEEPDLVEYFAAEVIGGPGAFVIEAADYAAFAEAFRRKLAREFAGPLVA